MPVRVGHTALTWEPLENLKDMEVCIRDCAELGFKGTETGGYIWDILEKKQPGGLKRILNQYDVKMACLFHFGEWTDQSIGNKLIEKGKIYSQAVQDLGGKILMIVPGTRREKPPYGLDEYKIMARSMNETGRIAAREGAICAMHPHWGTTAETRLQIELLLSMLDPENVFFAPDCGQIAKGGADASEVTKPHISRIRHVHLKDVSPKWQEMEKRGVPLSSPEGYAALGEGVMDVKGFIELIVQGGYEGWLMCELDKKTKATAREDAEVNKKFMQKLGFLTNSK